MGVIVLGAGLFWGRWILDEREFQQLASQGTPGLIGVEAVPSQGGGHAPGDLSYRDIFPTSGVHSLTWAGPGFYDERLTRAQVVHSLEHGQIVIYYDLPGDASLASLKKWAAHYGRNLSGGVVVVKAIGLGREVVLTAWTRRLSLVSFDPRTAAAFVDAFRGRGPEHATR